MLYQLSYTPEKTWCGKEKRAAPFLLMISQRRGSIWGSYCGASLESFPLRETTVARKKTIYEKGKVVFISGGFDRTELVASARHSFLLPSDQLAKGVEAVSGTKSVLESYSILRHGSCWPASAQLFESRTKWWLVEIRQVNKQCRREKSEIWLPSENDRWSVCYATYVDLDLADSSNWSTTWDW